MHYEEERKHVVMHDFKEQLAQLSQLLQNDEAKLQRDEEGTLEEDEAAQEKGKEAHRWAQSFHWKE